MNFDSLAEGFIDIPPHPTERVSRSEPWLGPGSGRSMFKVSMICGRQHLSQLPQYYLSLLSLISRIYQSEITMLETWSVIEGSVSVSIVAPWPQPLSFLSVITPLECPAISCTSRAPDLTNAKLINKNTEHVCPIERCGVR